MVSVNGQQVMRRWQAQNDTFHIPAVLAIVAFAPPVWFGAWIVIGVHGQSLLWCDDILLFGAALIGSITAFAAGARYRGTPAGRGWVAIAVGMLLMAFGEGAWGVQELVLRQEVASPSVADIGYLAFYPAVFLGLLMMPQAPVAGLRRAKLSLDLGAATAAIALVSFQFVIADLVAGSATLGDWITVAYPICDVFLISAAIVLLVRGGRNVTNMNLGLLALGFAAIGITDSLYTYLSSVNDYNSGNWIDVGWMVAYGLVILAGAGAATRTLNVDVFRNDEQHAAPLWQSLTLNATLIPVGVVLMLTDDRLIGAGFVSLVAVAFASHLLTHFEMVRLNGQLVEMAEEFKSRVRTDRIQSILQTNPQGDAKKSVQPERTTPGAWPRDVASDRVERFGR